MLRVHGVAFCERVAKVQRQSPASRELNEQAALAARRIEWAPKRQRHVWLRWRSSWRKRTLDPGKIAVPVQYVRAS